MRMTTNTFLPGRVHTVFVQANIGPNSCTIKVYRRPDMISLLAEHVHIGSAADWREIWTETNKAISSGEFVIDLEAK